MPYIKQKQRNNLDQQIKELAIAIQTSNEDPTFAGSLNYSITRLLCETYGPINKLKYKDFNDIIGMLECCKIEFYREMIAPYEDIKKKENGIVDLNLGKTI